MLMSVTRKLINDSGRGDEECITRCASSYDLFNALGWRDSFRLRDHHVLHSRPQLVGLHGLDIELSGVVYGCDTLNLWWRYLLLYYHDGSQRKQALQMLTSDEV